MRALVLVLLLACSAPKNEGATPTAPIADAGGETAASSADEDLATRIRLVVTGESRNLRACYEKGLERDPNLAGHVVLVLDVSEKGRATKVLEGKREGLGDDEIKCFARVLKAARFHDGAARSMRVQVPLTFSPRAESP